MRHQNGITSGFTLPELLVTLIVFAILSLAATSSFAWLMQENRMVVEVNRFVTVLYLARSEAIMQSRRIVLCPSASGVQCGNSREWDDGWLLFQSSDREYHDGDRLLRRGNPIQSGIRLHASNHRKRIVYQPNGSSGGSNSSFTFCDSREKAKPRVLCLSNSGRVRLTRKQCNGKPIDCASILDTGKP